MKLSVCMIVKNEEANLRRCLSQLKGVADELIVTDTGSSDGTKRIAAEFTGLIYDFDWIDDFSAARNAAFSHAAGDYIMWVDADDVISAGNGEKLRKLKKTLPPEIRGVYMDYNLFENGALIGSFPRLRMVRRDAGFLWRGRIHETLTADGIPQNQYYRSDIRISQNTKPRGATTRYLEILKNIVERDGASDPRSVFYYASELEKHGQNTKAAAQFEFYFSNGGLEDPNCVFAVVQLGGLYERTGETEKALALYSAAMPYCGRRAEYCCMLGNFYSETGGDPDEAAFWYETALGCPKPGGEMVLERYYYYLPHFRLYQIYDAAGDRQKSDAHLLLAAEEMKKLERK